MRTTSFLNRHSSIVIRKYSLLLIITLALLARLAMPLAGYNGITADSTTYLPLAEGLLAGKGFTGPDGLPTAQRAPVYPLFLAGMMAPARGSTLGVQIAQAILSALLAGALFEIALPILGARRALAAGLIFALDPVAIPSSAYVMTEAVGGMLLFLWLTALRRGATSRGYGLHAFAGLLGGALAYQTMITLLLHPLASALRFLSAPKLRKQVLLGLVIFALPIGAWSVRNARVLGEGTAVRTGGFGFLLWATVNYDFPWLLSPFDSRGDYIFEHEKRMNLQVPKSLQHEIYLKKALRRIEAEPVAAAWRMTKAVFWTWVEIPGAMKTLDDKPVVKWSLRAVNLLIILAALAGARRAWRVPEGRIAWGVLLYFTIFLAPLYPIPRYLLPLRPLLAFLAAFALPSSSRDSSR